ncbi:MAG: aldehyde dehydrogenase family protein [Vagococcus sp.]|uniref:aldehyde dehydrogenase family protein n=1 Tax=Vagococcus sp. TaxID=1933889 RepID=UPI002FCAB945
MIDEISEILKKQRDFFNTQKTYPIEFRVKQLKKLREQINRYEDELIDALNKDLGKASTESFMTELGLVYRHIDEMIKKLPKWADKNRVKTPLFLWPARSYTIQAPFGNTLILSPFNYPVLLTLDPLIGAIAGGNTAIIGMSEHTEHTNFILNTLVSEAFPTYYIKMITTSKEINGFLLDYPFDKIFFTGSEKVGKIVLKKAAENLTPVTLELGGKSPVVVTKYADLEIAADRVIWGKFLNAGQTCVAPDYCLIDATIQSEFLNMLKIRLVRFFGDYIEESPDYGRIINDNSMDRLIQLIERDQDYLYVGGNYNKKSKYIEPTILSGRMIDRLSSMSEEIFGPILPVLSYEKLEEVIPFIKATGQPLAFYPFSSDKREIDFLIEAIQFGGATINDTILHLANESLPFGGVGSSGMGHYHGKKSLEAFSHTKSILKRSTILKIPLMFPPFSKEKENTIRAFFK